MVRFALIIAFSVMLSGLLQEQPPQFRTGVKLVVVSAVVVDAAGMPVSGLRAEDFEVIEHGHPVSIAAFVPAPAGAPGAATSARAEPRFLVLLLDDVQIGADFARTKTIARMFAARMGPKDVGAVISLNAGAALTSTGSQQMLAAIDRFAPVPGGSVALPGVYKAYHALQAVTDLCRQLAAVPHRRKIVVWIGQADVFDPTEPTLPGARITSTDWQTAIVESARANVSVYIIDPAGLNGAQHDAASAFARETGGYAFFNTNFFERAVDRVCQEAAAYYLLSYEPSVSDDRSHQIEVRVKRRGVKVRARRARGPIGPAAAAAAPQPAPSSESGTRTPPGGNSVEVSRAPEKLARKAIADRNVAQTLARTAEYLEGYLQDLSAVVVEETYDQRVEVGRVGHNVRKARRLRSDLLLVRLPGRPGWTPFRDVFEVDGKPVRDRDDRLRRLFVEMPAGAPDAVRRILDEGARYNIGSVSRNINQPLLPLLFLLPESQGGFQWSFGGEEMIEDQKTWRIDYKETAQSTVIRQQDTGRSMPSSGSFWIEPATGRVVSTTVSTGDGTFRVIASVLYRRNDALGVFAPAQMSERYTSGPETIYGTATYQNFRRFVVKTEESIRIPK